jgi:hypothetical protein
MRSMLQVRLPAWGISRVGGWLVYNWLLDVQFFSLALEKGWEHSPFCRVGSAQLYQANGAVFGARVSVAGTVVMLMGGGEACVR